MLGHMLWTALVRRLTSGSDGRAAIVVGANEVGRRLASRIGKEPYLFMEVVGFFDAREPQRLGLNSDEKLLGRLEDVRQYVIDRGVSTVYIALPIASQPRVMQILQQLQDTTASIYFVPDVFSFDLVQPRLDNIGGIPVVAVCETPFEGINGVIKRISDFILAGLMVMLSLPVMLVIAAGVKLSSPGPILFAQRRYGLDGKEFRVYKFRSMTVCEDGERVAQARQDDPRTTRLGKLLRRSSLDELPQLFNVLLGSMSIIGPRPHAVAHNETYRKLILGYMVRHKVRPGITGWAQVNGLRGETDTVDQMKTRVEYDLQYLRQWSLWLDLKILLRTVSLVVNGHKAY
jgi:putative colanic acid biosynthesis UDP-glucose lipid carrier transferase